MIEFFSYWKLAFLKALITWWGFVCEQFAYAAVLSLAAFILSAVAKSNRDTVGEVFRQWWEAPMSSAHDLIWGGVGVLALIGASFLICLFIVAPQQIHSGIQAELEAANKALEETTSPAALRMKKGQTANAVMSPLIPDPNQRPANPDDLDFYFFSLWAMASEDNVQYAEVTITNRSERKMHLQLWGQIDYWKDNGEPARYGVEAEWNPRGLKENTGSQFVDLDGFETKRGRIVLFLGKPSGHGISNWFLDVTDNIYIEAFETVSGKRAAFKPMSGYPIDQRPAPLPSHNEMLTRDFPGEIVSKDKATGSKPFELILRTRDAKNNGTVAYRDVLIGNRSSRERELEVSLLIRSATETHTWKAIDGLFGDLGAEESQRSSVLKVGPGDIRPQLLAFDLGEIPGVSHNTSWALRNRDTLLQIKDRVSGETRWCPWHVGYPPGIDMRSADIIENPDPNSGNSQERATNDTQ